MELKLEFKQKIDQLKETPEKIIKNKLEYVNKWIDGNKYIYLHVFY
jgi:hypothetical protein